MAPAPVVDLADAFVLKAGTLFLVSLRDGTIPVGGDHPLGLYLDDCRHLSGHELRVGGATPRLLVSSETTGAEGVHELTNPDLVLGDGDGDGAILPLQTLRVRLELRIDPAGRLEERVLVDLHARRPLEIALELALAADFRPMLAIRRLVDLPPPPVELQPLQRGLAFGATTRDGVMRRTTVTAARRPSSIEGATLRFVLSLQAGGREEIRLLYELDEGAPPRGAGRAHVRVPDQAPETTQDRLSALTRVHAGDELFNRVMQRSLLDLRMLRSTLDGEEYYAAGVPWFCALFGRDSLITALEMLAFDAPVAQRTLRLLAERQGQRTDALHEEEPGKILHEYRVGEVAALGLTPVTHYYGTVDATPLFLCLVAEHATWSGDLDLFHELGDAVAAALGWIDEHGDHDGDGFLDYRAGTPQGLRNQGWKDSDDGIVDARGDSLAPPVALVEPQGYVVRAKRAIADLFGRDGDRETAQRLRSEAAELQERLGRFWDSRRRFYGLALDGAGALSSVLASNQGHLLWAGAVPGARAQDVRDALMSEAMFSGWGIRTLARGEVAFNPLGYHLGTVWPHDSAIVAAGLRRYGFDEDFDEIFAAMLEAASHAAGYRLPELFGGFAREQSEPPVPYPVACRPQAWAAGAIPFLLTTGLGLRADGLDGRLHVRRPSLPRRVDRLEVENLQVAGARVALLFERTGAGGPVALTDASIDGGVEVLVEIGGPRR